jgi:hypothetical protein
VVENATIAIVEVINKEDNTTVNNVIKNLVLTFNLSYQYFFNFLRLYAKIIFPIHILTQIKRILNNE